MRQVAFQGEIGAYSDAAVRSFFDDATLLPCTSFKAVFETLADGSCDHAVIPIENSLFGSVHANYDLFGEHEVQIVGELLLRIRHQLLAKENVEPGALTKVYSHPQALGQCAKFLSDICPQAEIIPWYDTAGAARHVSAQTDDSVSAIASVAAASEYGLNVIAADIEDDESNYTRFLHLMRIGERTMAEPEETRWKTSMTLTPSVNSPGTLYKCLSVFASRSVDLYKIESRPLVGSPFHYLFYLDVEGHVHDARIKDALGELNQHTSFVKLLGSYPVGSFIDA